MRQTFASRLQRRLRARCDIGANGGMKATDSGSIVQGWGSGLRSGRRPARCCQRAFMKSLGPQHQDVSQPRPPPMRCIAPVAQGEAPAFDKFTSIIAAPEVPAAACI